MFFSVKGFVWKEGGGGGGEWLYLIAKYLLISHPNQLNITLNHKISTIKIVSFYKEINIERKSLWIFFSIPRKKNKLILIQSKIDLLH